MCKLSVLSTLLLPLGYHKYLSITTFPQDPQQLKTLRSDVLRPLIDVVLRDLDLLAVVHVAAETTFNVLYMNTSRRRHAEYLQLKSTALVHDIIDLSLEGKTENTT